MSRPKYTIALVLGILMHPFFLANDAAAKSSKVRTKTSNAAHMNTGIQMAISGSGGSSKAFASTFAPPPSPGTNVGGGGRKRKLPFAPPPSPGTNPGDGKHPQSTNSTATEEHISKEELNEQQSQFAEIILEKGENVFLTGSAGVGKAFTYFVTSLSTPSFDTACMHYIY